MKSSHYGEQIKEIKHKSTIRFQPFNKKSLRWIWFENNSTYELTTDHERPERLISKFNEVKTNTSLL